MMRRSPTTPLALTGLGLGAVLYFSLSCAVTLEWIDEGQLVYQSWLVSQGAVPHREFQHVYGPAMYLVNGLLFRVFGSDLLVIRLSLVLLKAVISVLVYLAARYVTSPASALVAFGSTVIVWGGPWWVFNTPYASHYAVALVLSGVVIFLRQGGWRGALLAGLCCGLAATFKQTTGLFALLSLLLCLVWEATATKRDGATPGRLGPALRLLAVVGSGVIAGGYLARGTDWWTGFVLLGPFACAIAWIGAREVRHGQDAGTANLDALVAAGAGMAGPLVLCAAAYAALGLLTPVIDDTVSGLPRVIKWFIPIAVPDVRSSALALAAFVPVVGVYLLSRRPGPGAVVLAIGVGAAAVFAWGVMGSPGVIGYVSQGAWLGDAYRLIFVLPFVASWAALFALLRSGAGAAVPGAPPSAERARVLLTLVAASSLLSLHPAADFWHLIMLWPLVAPVLAWQVERAIHRPDGRTVPLAVVVVGAWLLVCGMSFLQAVVVARLNRPVERETFARASHIADDSQKLRDALALVRYLDDQPADRLLFSFGEGQMLYYLAGRRSVLERSEFVLYLVATGFVSDDAARRRMPQPDAVARLAAMRPLVVVLDDAPSTTRLRNVFADLAAYIDTQYRTVAAFGPYRVLAWAES